MSTRREKLEAMLRDDPHDPFLRYGLAMEHQKEANYDAALDLFRELQKQSPPYVPGFFRAGQMLADMGRVDEAREALRRGVEQARDQDDAHAAAEMSELLMELGSR